MNLIKKFLSFSVGSLGAAVIGFISIPIVTRILTPEEYGIATIFLTIGIILASISLAGLDQAFIRFFYVENNKRLLLLKTFGTSICVLFILATIIWIFDSNILNRIFKDNSYFILLVLYIFSYVFFRYSILILRMMQMGIRYSLVIVGQRLIDFIVIITIITRFTPNNKAIIFGSIISFIVMSIISLLLSKDFWKEKIMKENNSTNSTIRVLSKYSIPLMISGIIATLYQSIDKILLNHFSGNSELGIYTAAFQMAAVLNIVQTSFSVFWTPFSLEKYKENKKNNKLFGEISKIITIVMLILSVLLISFKDFLILFLDERYNEAALILPALIMMPVLFTMSETVVLGINFKLKSHLHIYIAIGTLATNALLSLILIPIFGSKGAAIAVAISYMVFYYMRTYYGKKLFYIENKLLETSFCLILLLIYILLTMFINNLYINIIGSMFCIVLIVILFNKELRLIYPLIISILKGTKNNYK
ncbi:lipopolysaccharide biosynthesis protein [Paenisporosarcina sp. OV554]|uniref:lipopolysaccharide biosynthesis protein n=1 Tax=Paenisporosarcina sp. OV554 TaxID=2135694 RepID=UPI000D39CB40|nr:oligosaccharide flippase family protein [Paenisporosarcina sp. OV554]PUB10190.1 O-antigen/teichoic acid export membrane protein [Paenisporosarcina sp. OV554]